MPGYHHHGLKHLPLGQSKYSSKSAYIPWKVWEENKFPQNNGNKVEDKKGKVITEFEIKIT
jgi:hypothetical protein